MENNKPLPTDGDGETTVNNQAIFVDDTDNSTLTFWQLIVKEKKNILILAFPFIIMDVFIKILTADVNYFQFQSIIPNILFSLTWIGIIVTLARSLKGNIGRIFYAVTFGLFYILFLTHYVYYPYTGFFFSFNLLQSASEGKAYILDTLKSVHFLNVLICLSTLASGVIVTVKFPKVRHNHFTRIIVFMASFIIIHTITPFLFGPLNSTLQWDTWRNPRNVYENFNDSNKCIKICGLYEYSFRDLYMTYLKSEEPENPEEIKFLEKMYYKPTTHEENNYTGIFKGKNVIFLQLEGLDKWLLTEKDTPTIYGMLNNSINFNNHYSYYTGGGSTFNSELAVSTGFITPISYVKNAYSFNQNYFPYSLPNMLKKEGYSVNAFHMNNGEYYMRDINYRNWGYDNYYSLMDTKKYTDISYQLDRELILNEVFYEKMFKQKTPFMNYVITYTPHTPFSIESKLGKLLAEKGDSKIQGPMSEEEVARLYASETDYMVKLLLKALEDNGLIDDTIIVAYADHYLYTLNDKTILDKHKTTEDNRINHTPFFVWSKDFERVDVTKVNSQLDILPTVLNLLGIEYCDENYIGSDILDDFYSGFVFFSDYSWFDGTNYVQYSDSVSTDVVQKKYIDDQNEKINTLIKKNDLTLKYDYFRRLENQK